MYEKSRDIESSFRLIRMSCVVLVLACFGFSGFAFYRASEEVRRASGRVYVLAAGKVMEAMASDRRENMPVEARDHVRTFHSLFFTLDPDDKVINDNLGRALYLADGSARREYEALKESGYYAGIITGNISERITVDSIHLDMTAYPFYFRLYGTETITRPTSTVIRDLVTEGYLREVSRSDNNPHGFLIERWTILSNRDLKTEGR
jgi:conjugative transposon TraK protein